MTRAPDRRVLLAALPAGLAAAGLPAAAAEPQADGRHDFDFLFGRWRVSHRRLKERLAADTRWETFAGTCACRPVLGGLGNVDDNVLELPAGTYQAVSIRKFDTAAKTWSIWWMDARSPGIEPPVQGGFTGGLGTFFGDDTLRGQPVKVRYSWAEISPQSAQWAQAFSGDGGATWETNWTMQFTREG